MGLKDGEEKGERFKWNFVFRFYGYAYDLADGSIEVNPPRTKEDEKDAACEGMHSFCTGHKTFFCDVRERVRDSCAEVTALQGRVILLIDHQEFWQNKFPDKFSWKRTISEGFLAGESGRCSPPIYAWNAIINFRRAQNSVSRRNFSRYRK